MESAARLLKNKKISREILSDDDVARAVWPAAVGKVIAAHTTRVKLVRTTLVVEVEDAIWQKQLARLSAAILIRLQKLTGSNDIKDIEFRIGIPRRQPKRADSRESSLPGAPFSAEDEAERIQDPVLKKVYRLSRRKATG
jgi:predicted nucleic acid-binding Zn ribbon protein